MAERIRRSVEERVAELDKKIEAHKTSIATLEAKKEALLNPKPRKRMTKKVKMEMLIKEALKQGLELDDIAAKLNVGSISSENDDSTDEVEDSDEETEENSDNEY